MSEKLTIEISFNYNVNDKFEFQFDEKKQVSTIKENQDLISYLIQKFNLGSLNVNIDFNFDPDPTENELIGEWFKRADVPKIIVSLKDSKKLEKVNIKSLGLNIEVLDLGLMSNSSAKRIEDALNSLEESNKKNFDEIKKENSELNKEKNIIFTNY